MEDTNDLLLLCELLLPGQWGIVVGGGGCRAGRARTSGGKGGIGRVRGDDF